MRLRYTPEALIELEATLDYITAQSPHGARRIQQRIKDLTELLCSHPFAGQATEEPGLRRLFATPYPYALYYQLSPEDVVIVAVRHTARDAASDAER